MTCVHKNITDTDIRVEIAQTPEEFETIYQLRYEIYCHEIHSLNPNDYPDKKEKDWFDQHSVHLIAKVGSRIIGTLRLIKNTPRGFLMEAQFPLPSWIDKTKAVEHSRGVVIKEYRGKGVYRHLLNKAYKWQLEHGYPICVGTPVMNTLGPIVLKDGWQPLEEKETVYHNITTIPMVFYLEGSRFEKK